MAFNVAGDNVYTVPPHIIHICFIRPLSLIEVGLVAIGVQSSLVGTYTHLTPN